MGSNKHIKELANFIMTQETYNHKECEECGLWKIDKCDSKCFANKIATDIYDTVCKKHIQDEYFEAIDIFHGALMDEFLRLYDYNDFSKLNLLTIGEVVDRIYDKCVNDMITKMKGGEE